MYLVLMPNLLQITYVYNAFGVITFFKSSAIVIHTGCFFEMLRESDLIISLLYCVKISII